MALSTWTQDIRFALRQLRRTPGFTAVAVLTLALGIGATSAVFTLIYQVMLRSIPIESPTQLYKIGKPNYCCNYSGTQDDWAIFSYDLYRSFREHTAGADDMAAVQAGSTTLTARREGENGSQALDIRFVSGNYFSLLGVHPYAGRLMQPSDDLPAATPVAVLSYPVWQTKFHGDPSLVGSTVRLSGHPVTVIGIIAEGFLGERNVADPPGVWLPLSQQPIMEPDRKVLDQPGTHFLDILVRIRDRSRVSQVEGSLRQQLRAWLDAHRQPNDGLTDKTLREQTTEIAPAFSGINDLRDQYQDNLKLLQMAAAFVLLIACANLANLLMVRGMARRQELSVRTAIGAPRGRLIRQMLVEAVVLAVLGGLASLLVAYAGTSAMLAWAMPQAKITPLQASPSLPLLAFSLALAGLTGLLFGMVPAWIASRSNPAEALRGANRSTRDVSALPQKILVVLQAALSLALLSSAGLLISSLGALQHQDFGFQPQGRLITFIDLPAAGYTADKMSDFYRKLDGAFTGAPAITHFAYATYGPMGDNSWNGGIKIPGISTEGKGAAGYTAVSTQYFDTLGQRILQGRNFSDADTDSNTHVAVVNQKFVSKYLNGKPALGMHFGPDDPMNTEWEIVGVVNDAKYRDPSGDPPAMFFTPLTQVVNFDRAHYSPDLLAAVHTAEGYKHLPAQLFFEYRGDSVSAANFVRERLKSIDANIPVLKLVTYDEQLGKQFLQERLVVRLTAIFGALALILAAVGLYGVTAYTVQRRTSEIGVRMALGATRADVLRAILRGALAQAVAGLLLGLPLAYLAARLLQHSLYKTGAFQPLVLLACAALLFLAAFVAAIVPARRAASLDPMQALRAE